MKPRPRVEPEPSEDELALTEFVEWLLFALDLPEVQAKIRALGPAPTPAPSTPTRAVPSRGAPRRRGR